MSSRKKRAKLASSDLVYVAAANQYARDVVDREIPACKWVRLACQRHLTDLAREKTAEFPYRFDPRRASRVCRFVEMLPHVKGQWARQVAGGTNLIRLEAWQKFITCVLFGWVEKSSGLRRFNEAYICIPRKNGKSIWAAAIGLYMLCMDGEYGAEVYSGATSEKQAWEVFRPAWRMVKKTPELHDYFGVEWAAKSVYIADDGSKFEPLIGDPGDGASPSCAIADEFHEHSSANLIDTMKTGMAARQQPLMIEITTAGSNIAGPCHDLQSEVEKMLDGLVENETRFGIIFTIDAEDDWTTVEAQKKANPNYGISVMPAFLDRQLRDAMQMASKQNVYKTKHLNIWVGAATAWVNMELWRKAADPSLKIEEFAGQDCYEADDLSAKIDLTARMRVFVRQEEDREPDEFGKKYWRKHYYVFGRYYLPADRAMDPRCQHYQRWVHEDLLQTNPGPEIRYEAIKQDILADSKRYHLRCVAFDPWGAQQLRQELDDELPDGTVIEIPQQTRFLSEPMKEIEAALAGGRLHHDGDKALAWQVSNIVARVDANGNLFPRKERDENKIDGGVALIMAISRAMLAQPKKRSVYATRGILTL